MSDMHSVKVKLTDHVNEGYSSLSKWLIGLSAGAIVFSVGLVKPGKVDHVNFLLIDGLVCLVISVLMGTIFVRYRLDASHYELLGLDAKDKINSLPINHDNEKRIKSLNRIVKKAKRKFKIINSLLTILLYVQQWTFFFGVLCIAVWGVLLINF